MHNLIHYKEHYGRISFSARDNQFTSNIKGKNMGNNLSVKGSSEEEVKSAFKNCIDELINQNSAKKS